jgi:hypothetical protein
MQMMAYSETAIRHVDDEKRVQPFPGQMLMTFLPVAFEQRCGRSL